MSEMLLVVAIFCLSLTSGLAENDTATASPRPKVHKVIFKEDSEQECSLRFIEFKGAYLRGVKSPNLLSYNVSTYDDCQMRCCYETSFECRSFSYFEPLHQCFIMNLTRFDHRVELTDVNGYIHVQRMPDSDLTTSIMETTIEPRKGTTASLYDEETTREEASTKPNLNDFIIITTGYENLNNDVDGSGMEGVVTDRGKQTNSSRMGPDKGVMQASESPEKMVSNDCPLTCENEGRCGFRPKLEDGEGQEAFCACEKGYQGEKCETVVTEEAGFPVWIIVIVVIGGLILILVIVCCVLLQVYKRKKGEYRVVEWARRWARRGKKPKKPDNPDELAHVEESPADVTSPTTSVQSIQNYNSSSSSMAAV